MAATPSITQQWKCICFRSLGFDTLNIHASGNATAAAGADSTMHSDTAESRVALNLALQRGEISGVVGRKISARLEYVSAMPSEETTAVRPA